MSQNEKKNKNIFAGSWKNLLTFKNVEIKFCLDIHSY